MKPCPRCNVYYIEHPAISRFDNKSEVCSTCGTEEALTQFLHPEVPLTGPADWPLANPFEHEEWDTQANPQAIRIP